MYACMPKLRNPLYRRAVGTQAFSQATAFNANIAASWNVQSITTFFSAFESVGLTDCIKRGIYDNWGSMLRSAYPAWNSLSCITNSNIGAAVTAWATDPTTATTTYGNIADWNTAAVTSMASLFADKPTLNADISKWNVASVANMYQVCANKIELSLVRTYPRVVGSQTFSSAKTFIANIGAWNIASVSNMSNVCVLAGGAKRGADTCAVLGFRCDVVVCATTPPL